MEVEQLKAEQMNSNGQVYNRQELFLKDIDKQRNQIRNLLNENEMLKNRLQEMSTENQMLA